MHKFACGGGKLTHGFVNKETKKDKKKKNTKPKPSVTHTDKHTQGKCYNIMPERNLEDDPWGVGGRSWGNSSDELWQFEWDFMVGTARDRDIYQPSLQRAGKHRSGRLYPVAQPEAHHTPQIQIQSSITLPLLITAYLLMVFCEMCQGILPPVSPILLWDRKGLNRSQLTLISGQLASFFVYNRVCIIFGKGNYGRAVKDSLVVCWAHVVCPKQVLKHKRCQSSK